jgi:hypothetical protein
MVAKIHRIIESDTLPLNLIKPSTIIRLDLIHGKCIKTSHLHDPNTTDRFISGILLNGTAFA